MCVGGQPPLPRHFIPGKGPGTHFTERKVEFRVNIDKSGKSPPPS